MVARMQSCHQNKSCCQIFSNDDLKKEIEKTIPNLRRYARSLAQNVDDADDVVQETLLLALSRLHQFKPHANLKAWLFTIARNSFISSIRRKRPFVELSDESCLPVTGPAQEHRIMLNETARAYGRLLPSHREIIALIVFEGMKYEEASELLGVPVGTVRSRLSRARALLREAQDGVAMNRQQHQRQETEPEFRLAVPA